MMVCFLMIPRISRNDVAFGVNVPTGVKQDLEMFKIKRRFMALGIVVGIGVMVTQVLIPKDELSFMMLLIVSMLLYLGVYLLAYRQMVGLKKEKQWKVASSNVVVDTEFRKRQLTVSPKWYILYGLIFVASIVTVAIMYDQLPQMLTTQVNSSGEGTTFMEKDRALMVLLGTQLFVMALMVFIQFIIKKAKQTLSSTNTQQSIEANVSFRHVFSVILYVLGLAVGLVMYMSLLFTMGIIHSSELFLVLTLILVFVPTGILLIYSLKYGQDGSRLTREGRDVIDKDDDHLWKLGVLYFNPKDPSVFISKRVGIGWTLNYARWQSWMFFVVLAAVIIIVVNL